MKYFTNWSAYTIKVVIPLLRMIYIFHHIDPTFAVSLIVSTARIFIYVSHYRVWTIALLISIDL